MPDSELIERDDFLAAMDKQLGKINSGEGHSLFIAGEAGIGKTSLVKAFLKSTGDNCIAYTCACDYLFTPRPLAPLYDLAMQLKQGFAANIHSIPSRAELFTKFAEELSNKNKPVILVFEDIHWADEATLDFVKYFARRISRTKCLFILTFRDDEIHQQHPLRNVLGELSPDTFTRIVLKTLSRQAVQMMADKKGYDGEDVYSISGGNPFYVNEILASYSAGIPENIKDAVLSVYNRADSATKEAWQLLSVIPEGFEISGPGKVNPDFNASITGCIEKNIIQINNGKIFFKHELYRRTIENSLSPFKRIELNKTLLRVFLDEFESNGEIERIVHHAKNANENGIVVKYAPIAAANAACVGAHVEAAKLYLTAIEYSSGNDKEQLVCFYESYAYECYLTNQIKESIIFQGKALKIWKEKNVIEKMGQSLRFLSRFWWYEGNGEKAEAYAKEAIEVLNLQPSSVIKAMAFSNMSQLKMLSEANAECIEWGNKAIAMATELNDKETLSHALNNVGTAKMKMEGEYENGRKLLQESLDIALENSFHEQVARAYTNLISNSIAFKEYAAASEFLQEGLQYSEKRELDSWTRYKLICKARMLLETGSWDEATLIAENLIRTGRQRDIVKIAALVVLGTIKFRKGESEVLEFLEEAKQLAFATREYQRIMPVMVACLEYEWLTGNKIINAEELDFTINLLKQVEHIFQNSECIYWLQKAGRLKLKLPFVYEPYLLLEKGKIKQAAAFWHSKGCTYEQAFALFEGNDDDKRNALSIVHKLGATTVYEKMKMEMRSSGIKKIPRGQRESTKNNPLQLTNRELDILPLLKKGIQNKEIANTLFISPKTVDHHISSILFKLDVNTRVKAVDEATRIGILK